MNHQHIAESLQQAWLHKEYDVLESILSDGPLQWYEDPFEPMLDSNAAVVERWRRDVAEQSELRVAVQVLDTVAERGYYACQAGWVDETGKVHDIDGIFVVRLDGKGKIAYFNQWWASRP